MKLDAKTRKAASKDIMNFLKPTYFPTIPLEGICTILDQHGLILLQEDNTPWSGFLLGKNEHVLFSLGKTSTAKKENGLVFYEPLSNTGLCLSWYKDDSRKNIEVIGYLS
jgi:hypothetical protein